MVYQSMVFVIFFIKNCSAYGYYDSYAFYGEAYPQYYMAIPEMETGVSQSTVKAFSDGKLLILLVEIILRVPEALLTREINRFRVDLPRFSGNEVKFNCDANAAHEVTNINYNDDILLFGKLNFVEHI